MTLTGRMKFLSANRKPLELADLPKDLLLPLLVDLPVKLLLRLAASPELHLGVPRLLRPKSKSQ